MFIGYSLGFENIDPVFLQALTLYAHHYEVLFLNSMMMMILGKQAAIRFRHQIKQMLPQLNSTS